MTIKLEKIEKILPIIFILPLIYISIFLGIKIYFYTWYQQLILFSSINKFVELTLFAIILICAIRFIIYYKNYSFLAIACILFIYSCLSQNDNRIHQIYFRGFFISSLCIYSYICLLTKQNNLYRFIPKRYYFPFFFIPFLYLLFTSYLSGLSLDWYHSRPSRLNDLPISIFFAEQDKSYFDILLYSGFLIFFVELSNSNIKDQMIEKDLYVNKTGFNKWIIIIIILIAGGSHIFFSERILAYNNNIQAYILMHLDKLDKAEKYFKKVLLYSPENTKAMLNIGAVYMFKNEYIIARHYFNTVLKKKPDNENANFQLGFIDKIEGKIDNAFIRFKKALEVNPDSIKIHENLGSLYFDQNNFSKAFMHFQSVVDLDPGYPKGLYHLAIVLSKMGQKEASAELLSDALMLNPFYVEAHDNIGVTYVNKGNIEKAVMHFRIAMQINPEYQPAKKHFESLTKRIFDFARSCESNDQPDKAISLYKKLSKIRPQWSGSLYYNISKLYSQKKDAETSIDWLKKAVENNFCSWDILKADNNFETIKHHPFYQHLIRKKE